MRKEQLYDVVVVDPYSGERRTIAHGKRRETAVAAQILWGGLFYKGQKIEIEPMKEAANDK